MVDVRFVKGTLVKKVVNIDVVYIRRFVERTRLALPLDIGILND